MRRLMTIHRYLSCFVAPAMLFFAISGAWQAFRWQETRKDGSYVAPMALQTLSHFHKAERLSAPYGDWFRYGQLFVSAAFVATALVGLAMAFRIARPAWTVWLCLAAGVALPLCLAIAAHSAP
jgi:hypothetical protein